MDIFYRSARSRKVVIPNGMIELFRAYDIIGRNYFDKYWLNSIVLSKCKPNSLLDYLHSLSEYSYNHENMLKISISITEKLKRSFKRYGGEYIEKDCFKETAKSRNKSLKDFKTFGMEIIGSRDSINEKDFLKLKNDEKESNKIFICPELEYPRIYHIIQHQLIQKDLIRILHAGHINCSPFVGSLLSDCGNLTNIPINKWLTSDLEYCFSDWCKAQMTEYNGLISKTIYQGQLVIDKKAFNMYLDIIMKSKADMKVANQLKPVIKDSQINFVSNPLALPAISPITTENWKDDVKMAFNNYYLEHNVSPSAKELCDYIQKQKANNNYAQYIEYISNNKPLKIIKDGVSEVRGWDTFTKQVSNAKKGIKIAI